ncbi:MAG: hypothetical protein K2N43_06975, partial [Lachnospiraceae bacterium]|nr:hypothetical protein [Lachnospiraceae bacterium]
MDKKENVWKQLLAALIAVCFVLPLLGCKANDSQETQEISTETERLAKLCRVWGYVKYTHPAFLFGEKDWDEELLSLIPQVREQETSEEVNELLHQWFISLGEIDYRRRGTAHTSNKEDWVIETDISWTEDTDYLGKNLAADFAQLPEELPDLLNRNKAPVSFDEQTSVPDFSNEQDHAGGYDDAGFRLLGLFRLWNGIEYYFPYLHLMDESWESCLPDAIDNMMAGTDQASYEETIYELIGHLHDNHVMVVDSDTKKSTIGQYFAEYGFPAPLEEAEGKLVVTEGVEGCPLATGDVLTALNGEAIDAIAEAAKKYFSITREEVFLENARYLITTSETEDMEVTVLRGNEELTLSVKGTLHSTYNSKGSKAPYEILDGGIGLINPEAIDGVNTLYETMNAVKDTQALVIDLRQYPGFTSFEFMYLYFYLPSTYREVMTFARPTETVPGSYIQNVQYYGYTPWVLSVSENFYPYEKPVAVLMDKTSLSLSEMAITVFRTDENVVV